MKSYFLAPISSRGVAISALNAALPNEGETWLLKDNAGDVIAYFSLVERDDTTGLRTVVADISGRHYNSDAEVVALLDKLRDATGGEVTNDA